MARARGDLERKEAELEERESDLEAEKDAIRLEGVSDCADLIPMVLPSLNMDPIYAAISFCKGDISEEEFRKWLSPPPKGVMDPAPLSVVPAPEASQGERPEVPAVGEDCPEIPPPIPEVEVSPAAGVEATVPPPDSEPLLLSSESVEEEIHAPARAE